MLLGNVIGQCLCSASGAPPEPREIEGLGPTTLTGPPQQQLPHLCGLTAAGLGLELPYMRFPGTTLDSG